MSTLLIEVDGVPYENFEDATVTNQIDAIAGSFSFISVLASDNIMPFGVGDACKITADNEVILTGFIEVIAVDYNSNSHSIFISGRSKTADIIDSSIDKIELSGNISLKSIIEKVISHIGASIDVVNNVNNIEKFNIAEDQITASAGDNAFQFIENLARKRQVLLTTNGDGDVVITNSGVDIAPYPLQNLLGDDTNNIESASITRDITQRFGKYIVSSQLSPTVLNLSGGASAKQIATQKSKAVIDNDVRQSRQLAIKAEKSSSTDQTLKRAQWEADIRKARSIVYSTSVQKFSLDGKLWKPNQITAIRDEFAGLDESMLVNSVSYNLGVAGGSVTLSFVAADAYTADLSEPQTEKGPSLAFKLN